VRSPSSLIFLVLLGVWAAYFLQYWIRRRDHLATARSVEQFSEAMRVLEQREVTPRTDLSEPAPRSWAVHPAKASRPQVLVKRAVPADPPRVTVTARVDDDASAPAWTRPSATRPAPSAPVPPAAPRRPARVAAPAAEARPVPAARAPRVRPSRRARAVLLLVALLEMATMAVLVPLGMLPWWALAPALVAVLAAFAYVRSGARAERSLRAAHRRRLAEEARRRAAASPATADPGRRPVRRAAPATVTGAATSGPPHADDTVTDVGDGELSASVEVSLEASAEPTDGAAVPPAEVVAESSPLPAAEPEVRYVHLVDEDDIPLTWDPVPVPRPTYTMKAKAERPEVAPADVTPEPAPVALPDEQELPERRVAGA
jgi:hypothetical protein